MPPTSTMENITENTGKQLLDFSQKLDISLLDKVVSCMYNGTGAQQKLAEQILTTLKEHPDSWTRVDSILEYSNNQQTKYFALQILEQVIKTRWKILPREQCEGMKKYIVGIIIKTSSNIDLLEKESIYLGKLNMILVQILKHEWPKNWPTFITDIVGSSKTNESLCQNNMVILKLLSEEVFDFSLGQMTQTKAKHLKDSMCAEFSQIFQLCQYVMSNSQNAPLVSATLNTLLRFMHWIPLGYIFETQLINVLIEKFLRVPLFRNVALKCLTEIAGVTATEYSAKFGELFLSTTQTISSLLGNTTNIREAYQYGQGDEQNFVQNLALFYCTFLKEHNSIIESKSDNTASLMEALNYLLLISEVDDVEIFKICLEYWNTLASELYREGPFYRGLASPANSVDSNARRQLYNGVLTRLRRIMISRMAKPEEVLVVENEQGEVVREFMKDTDSINLYKNMRETLVYLTHLDYMDTEQIMTEKLRKQVDGSEWSWKNLNTLCWAIGSISGAMHEDDERRFLVIAIRDLLGLCEQKKGKDNKAIVASNIMYVVGQYPRFLRAHWRFLKTVVTKLFEFMHETHEGVQDMACDTFIKIAHKCRRQFVTVQAGEAVSFIEEILSSINMIICDLQPQQVHTFYEAVAMMVAAQNEPQLQELLITKLFHLPNQVWDGIIQQATQNVEILKDHEIVKQLANILKTNVSSCKSLGHEYLQQLGRIYLDMLNVYKVMSENINGAITTNGEQVTKQPLIRSMRTVKKETLKLISNWVQKCLDPAVVADNFIPHLLDAVLYDYQRNIPAAREPEVLSTMTAIVNRLHSHVTPKVPAILDAVFQCTLEMINKDMEEFPEHRTYFFSLLEAVTSKCFPAFLQLDTEKFKLVLDSVIWAIKHTMRQVSETGLNILSSILSNVATIDNDKQQQFYVTFFMDILQHMFVVVTDSSQSGNLTTQASIMAEMFKILEDGRITLPLSNTITAGGNAATANLQFVQENLAVILKHAFPHLQHAQIRVFIEGLISFDRDIAAFREHVRDFLVQIREFTGEDLSDLYLEEREIEINHAQDDKRRKQAEVPGILGPHEIVEEMAE